MNKLNSLRALIVKKEFSAKHLILSTGEIDVVNLAAVKPITSTELTVKRGISAQQACNMLTKLKTKGYLESRIVHHPGHMPYSVYSIPKPLRRLLWRVSTKVEKDRVHGNKTKSKRNPSTLTTTRLNSKSNAVRSAICPYQISVNVIKSRLHPMGILVMILIS